MRIGTLGSYWRERIKVPYKCVLDELKSNLAIPQSLISRLKYSWKLSPSPPSLSNELAESDTKANRWISLRLI